MINMPSVVSIIHLLIFGKPIYFRKTIVYLGFTRLRAAAKGIDLATAILEVVSRTVKHFLAFDDTYPLFMQPFVRTWFPENKNTTYGLNRQDSRVCCQTNPLY